MPTWLAILLGVFWLGVLATVAFTALRLAGNLKALSRSLARLNDQLTPAIEELAERSEQAAEHAARLSAGATARGAAPGAGKPSPPARRRR